MDPGLLNAPLLNLGVPAPAGATAKDRRIAVLTKAPKKSRARAATAAEAAVPASADAPEASSTSHPGVFTAPHRPGSLTVPDLDFTAVDHFPPTSGDSMFDSLHGPSRPFTSAALEGSWSREEADAYNSRSLQPTPRRSPRETPAEVIAKAEAMLERLGAISHEYKRALASTLDICPSASFRVARRPNPQAIALHARSLLLSPAKRLVAGEPHAWNLEYDAPASNSASALLASLYRLSCCF